MCGKPDEKKAKQEKHKLSIDMKYFQKHLEVCNITSPLYNAKNDVHVNKLETHNSF